MSSMKFNGRVVRWIDGDTVDLMMDLGFRVYSQQRIRLARINTPEKGRPGFEEATKAAASMVPVGTLVSVTCLGRDPYDRWIAELPVITGGLDELEMNVSDALIARGLAVSYKSSVK